MFCLICREFSRPGGLCPYPPESCKASSEPLTWRKVIKRARRSSNQSSGLRGPPELRVVLKTMSLSQYARGSSGKVRAKAHAEAEEQHCQREAFFALGCSLQRCGQHNSHVSTLAVSSVASCSLLPSVAGGVLVSSSQRRQTGQTQRQLTCSFLPQLTQICLCLLLLPMA